MPFTASEMASLTVGIGPVATILAAIISAIAILGAPIVSATIEAYKEKVSRFDVAIT